MAFLCDPCASVVNLLPVGLLRGLDRKRFFLFSFLFSLFFFVFFVSLW
jgi:hypothetical protein